MTTTVTSIADREIQGAIANDTIRPQLFVVADGSYVSNGSYGSGAAAVEPGTANLEAVTLRGANSPYIQTKCNIREHDHETMFTLAITLDTTAAAPVVTSTDELRIRTLPISSSEPGRYLNRLPAHDTAYGMPYFEDVELVTIDTTGAAAPVPVAALTGVALRARLLHGGELALLQVPDPATIELPIDFADISGLFGQADTALRISVRGRYRAVSSRAGVAS